MSPGSSTVAWIHPRDSTSSIESEFKKINVCLLKNLTKNEPWDTNRVSSESQHQSVMAPLGVRGNDLLQGWCSKPASGKVLAGKAPGYQHGRLCPPSAQRGHMSSTLHL